MFFSDLGQWMPAISLAFLNTIYISIISFIFATLIGTIIAIGRLSDNRLISRFCRCYIEVLRGVPTLVILFLAYQALPNIGLVFNEFNSAIIGLSIGASGYAAEIIRAGLKAVHFGQREASLASGLTPIQTFYTIIFPQALKLILAPLCNLLIVVVKDSSLAALITTPELTLTAKDLASTTFQPIQIYLCIGVAYLLITIPLDSMARSFEKRLYNR